MTQSHKMYLVVSGLAILGVAVLVGSFAVSYFRIRSGEEMKESAPVREVVVAPTNPCLGSDGVQTGAFASFESAFVRPAEVCGLALLGKNLVTVPSEITNLKNVKIINFLKNNLTDIPPYIGEVTSLEVLILSQNSISTIPDEIGLLPHLEVVHLVGNPVSSEEQARVQAQFPHIKFYF